MDFRRQQKCKSKMFIRNLQPNVNKRQQSVRKSPESGHLISVLLLESCPALSTAPAPAPAHAPS